MVPINRTHVPWVVVQQCHQSDQCHEQDGSDVVQPWDMLHDLHAHRHQYCAGNCCCPWLHTPVRVGVRGTELHITMYMHVQMYSRVYSTQIINAHL